MSNILLSLKNATITFGGLTAVNDVTFDVPQGSLFGLIGPNGAGKTTLFNMITGVYKPTSGVLQFKGMTLNSLKLHEVVKLGIARTFQNIRIFGSLSALENVVVGGFLHHKTNMLHAAVNANSALQESADLRNQGRELLKIFDLEKAADVRSCDLPYGMQRRLEIARALATKPSLLLLDEPAAGMNPQESSDLMDDIRKLRDEHGQSILLIEHDMKFVMGICEQIVVLNYGEVLAEGTAKEIASNPSVIKAYLGEADE